MPIESVAPIGHDRKDRGEIAPSRYFRHCQSLLRNERIFNMIANANRPLHN